MNGTIPLDSRVRDLHIGYIASMKRSLPSFVYREIKELMDLGVSITLFATKQGKGIYMPDRSWRFYPLRPVRTLGWQPLAFASRPAQYTRLFGEALRSRSLLHFAIACDFARAMERHRVTAIHCVEGLHSMYIGYYCKKLLGLPLSVMIHADSLYIGSKWPVFRDALRACDQIATVCEYNRVKLVEEFGIPQEKIKVVRLCVDTEAFGPSNKINILIVGQFSMRKGHDTLFKAVRALRRPDIHVWVVGDGTWGNGDYADVRGLAREIGIQAQVTFFGSVSEDLLRILYRSCDVFCLPSRTYIVKEGLPVSLMEAMASERPVISTRHAGIPELVPDILVEEDDFDGVARAIAYLADNPDVRERMGKRNRAIVEQHYSIRNIEQIRDLFLEEALNAEGNDYRRGRVRRLSVS
ncbi:MAG: glycosyltransferase family 4 protein [Chloroflexi bacterium]|nr:glycosyltransferase family 4 protein [Chloroflexota bacterium]